MNEKTRQITRRDFIGRIGLAAGGMAALSPMPTAAVPVRTGKSGSPRAKRILILGLDGICVEGFRKARTSHLDALMKRGAFSLDTRVVMPSVTLPNWTSHLTGSGPEQHGVFNNNWTLEKAVAKSAYPPVRTDQQGYYPSVFQILKEGLPACRTAFYWNWEPLIRPYHDKYLDERSFLKDDAYVENYGKALQFMKKNRSVLTLVFLYSVHTDHAGHKYNWMSDQYIKSIEEADGHIGQLFRDMEREELLQDAHILFLTDHGGIGSGHGGTSAAEMIVPWGIAGPGIKKGYAITEPNNTVNTAPMILHLFGLEPPIAWTGSILESVFC